MPNDVLSPAEVECLLAPSAVPYDFTRAVRMGKERLQSLRSLHEEFGRGLSAGLATMLRCRVVATVESVDEIAYSQFTCGLENPTCFNVIEAGPPVGNLILDIRLSILFPMIEQLLGGGAEAAQIARRPLTEIELRLAGRITGLMLDELRKAWEPVAPLLFSAPRVEHNPHLMPVWPPHEKVLRIGLELCVGDQSGLLHLCIPRSAIERLDGNLATNCRIDREYIGGPLTDSPVELVVTLATTRISPADLHGLRVGDIITTDHPQRQPLEVALQGVPKFLARPGALQGRKAIEIEELSPERP